ncbi:MAG: hypothetical protein HZB51_25145 [Chloroflexi bacterium]|nr:hypothetical protein [Chloroflexota bacterium]
MSERGPNLWRQPQCCGGQREEIVQVDLFGDGHIVGLVALDQIFEQLYAMDRAPEESLKDELVKMVAAKNYIAPKAEHQYAAGLLREYAKFCTQKKTQNSGGHG